MPSAIGKSKRPPSLGKSAGARLTVIRLLGNSKPHVSRAARTRSLLSRTAASGKPTIDKDGRPLARCTSTMTDGASIPSTARLFITAKAIVPLREVHNDFHSLSLAPTGEQVVIMPDER